MAPFRDAPHYMRCKAQVRPLKDGSTARCGKTIDQPKCRVCKQHRKMFREGKPLIDHTTGEPMGSIIDREVYIHRTDWRE